MFRVYYKYSACVLIVTSDVAVLCDPWFSDSAYHGTWACYPQYEVTRSFIGNFDYIYLSHIHPDHYCKDTIYKLFSLFGPKPILISYRNNRDYLHKKLINDGLGSNVRVIKHFAIGNTHINLFPVDTNSRTDIDSAMLVSCSLTKYAFLNTNDCEVDTDLATRINSVIDRYDLDLRLFALGYSGAGPYPQTYIPLCDKALLEERALSKKQEFFNRYLAATRLIDSRFRLPFAGKYLLNGPSSPLNQYRGVADATEVSNIDPHSTIIADGGHHYFDLNSLEATKVRSQPYIIPEYVSSSKYEWDNYIRFELNDSKLKNLSKLALDNAHRQSDCEQDYIWCIFIIPDDVAIAEIYNRQDPRLCTQALLAFNVNKLKHYSETDVVPLVTCDMFITAKAFIAAVLGVCHWNNYEIGSVFHVRRRPDTYVSTMYSYLYHMHI